MPFVQPIGFKTSRPGEIETLVKDWREKTAGRRTAQQGTLSQDRDRPDAYVQIVQFPPL